MLLYCEHCQLAFGSNRCPICRDRNVRQPRSNDPCFLSEKQIIWGEMLEDVLKQNGIPVLMKKKMGAGMALKVGPMLERVELYVPFSRLQDAERIEAELFSETDGDEM